MSSSSDAAELARWAEAIAAVGRTGLAFSTDEYDRERFEELLHVAADMLHASAKSGTGALTAVDDVPTVDDRVAAWLGSVVPGVPGYVTPKVAVGAVVGNERDEILLIQRSDNQRWFIPTGWADVGYSPAEVVVKEVREECGLHVRPVAVIGVLDGMRAGSPIPHYTILFKCELLGGELQAHPLECLDIGWFAEDALPSPLFWSHWWKDMAFAAVRDELRQPVFDAPREPVWRPSPSAQSEESGQLPT